MMRAPGQDELWKELDALTARAVESLLAVPAEVRWRLLRRYSEKSRLCILISALAQLGEARRRTVALNARIGSLQWSRRVEMEILRRGSQPLEDNLFRLEGPANVEAKRPAGPDAPAEAPCPTPSD